MTIYADVTNPTIKSLPADQKVAAGSKFARLYDPETRDRQIDNDKMVLSASEISSWTFDIYPTHPLYGLLDINRTRVRVIDRTRGTSTMLFKGRVHTISKNMSSDGIPYKTVTVTDAMSYLQDTVCIWNSTRKWWNGSLVRVLNGAAYRRYRAKIDEDGNRTIDCRALCKIIIDDHNKQCKNNNEGWKYIHFDVMSFNFAPNDTVDISEECEMTSYEALQKILKECGGEMRIRYVLCDDGVGRLYFQYSRMIGRKGDEAIKGRSFSVGRNLLDYSRQVSSSNVITRLFVSGPEYSKLDATSNPGRKAVGCYFKSEKRFNEKSSQGTVRFKVKGGLKVKVVSTSRTKGENIITFVNSKKYDTSKSPQEQDSDYVVGHDSANETSTKQKTYWYKVPDDADYCFVSGSSSQLRLYKHYMYSTGKKDSDGNIIKYPMKDDYRLELWRAKKAINSTADGKRWWEKTFTNNPNLAYGYVKDTDGSKHYYIENVPARRKYGIRSGGLVIDKFWDFGAIDDGSKKKVSINQYKISLAKARKFVKKAINYLHEHDKRELTVTLTPTDLYYAGADVKRIRLYDWWTVKSDLPGATINELVEIVRISFSVKTPYEPTVDLGDDVMTRRYKNEGFKLRDTMRANKIAAASEACRDTMAGGHTVDYVLDEGSATLFVTV